MGKKSFRPNKDCVGFVLVHLFLWNCNLPAQASVLLYREWKEVVQVLQLNDIHSLHVKVLLM